MKALIGQKKEMTQIFDSSGAVIPVTVVSYDEVFVVAKKNSEKDKYSALVFGLGKKKKPNKSELGKYSALGFVPEQVVEVRVNEKDLDNYEIGKQVSAEVFELKEKVNVIGVSKGKGFQGVVKRWGFKGGPKTHGQSDRHRAPGSIGSGTTPGRVYKGKKMAGRMGGEQVTVKNLKVALVDDENKMIAIKGALPGSKGSFVIVKSV